MILSTSISIFEHTVDLVTRRYSTLLLAARRDAGLARDRAREVLPAPKATAKWTFARERTNLADHVLTRQKETSERWRGGRFSWLNQRKDFSKPAILVPRPRILFCYSRWGSKGGKVWQESSQGQGRVEEIEVRSRLAPDRKHQALAGSVNQQFGPLLYTISVWALPAVIAIIDRHPGIALDDLLLDAEHMHDRKDARPVPVGDLFVLVVGKQACHARVLLHQRLDQVRMQQGIELAARELTFDGFVVAESDDPAAGRRIRSFRRARKPIRSNPPARRIRFRECRASR
jgi:hypothetical protein